MSTGGSYISSGSITAPENIIDFDINDDPNTVGTIFSPSEPHNLDVMYRCMINNSIWMWNGTSYINAGLKKFRAVQDLSIGANVINHNFGLNSPYAVSVEVRSIAGSFITVGISTETTNSVTINSGSLITSAKITIVGWYDFYLI